MKIRVPFAALSMVGSLTALLLLSTSCARTEVVESPRTIFASAKDAPETPSLIWTSRTLGQTYDYLGVVKVRSWTYNGALQRLIEGGKELHADAVIDVHYQRVGFLDTMEAFAVKFRNKP